MGRRPAGRPPGRGRSLPWLREPDARLLEWRLCDLGVTIEGSALEERVRQLQVELERRDLPLRPHTWLSTEWFSPKGVPGIAIPFYLAHPRLIQLERSRMLEAEGADRKECQRILRHECGHAVQHAWQLHRRHEWQRLFGRSSQRYPDAYRPNPASRNHVLHLRLYYAQSHPDEDFAETFAVWLQPRARWLQRYRGWPALQKLEYVDGLMEEIRGRPPLVRTRRVVDPLASVRLTLREYYDQKLKSHTRGHPEVYDRHLKELFSDEPRHRHRERASAFLRRNRADIRRLVARWTEEYQYTLDQVLTDMIERCRELKLRAVGSERKLRMEFAVLLTVQTMHFHYSRQNWVSL